MPHRAGLNGGQTAANRGNRHTGGRGDVALKGLRRGLGNHHPHRPDLGVCQNRAGQLSLFCPPISRVKHLRCGAKARQPIQQFIPGAAVCGQPFGGKRHAQTVTLGVIDKDRITTNLIADATLIKGGHNIARGRTVQSRIKQGHVRCARHT